MNTTKKRKNGIKLTSRVEELKKKINDESYLKTAVNRMATDICDVFFK